MSDKPAFMITGGAGFLGINFIRYLLSRGHPVTSLDIAPFDYPERDQVNDVLGDIRVREDVEKAMQGVDVVVHAAAALPLYEPEEIMSTDLGGTRMVLEVAQEHGVDRVIHVSTTAVYGIPDHHPLYETDEVDGVGPYGEAKVQAEQVCFEFREKGMCIPIVRPKSFIGPERLGVFAMLYDWARTGHNWPVFLGFRGGRGECTTIGVLSVLMFLPMLITGGLATYQIRQREAEYGISQVFIAFDITQPAGADWVEQEVENIIADLHQAQPDTSTAEVLFPGERVLRTRRENLTNGIPVDEVVWQEILQM